MSHITSFIDGEYVDTAASYDDTDPSTGLVVATVSRGGRDEIGQAVAAARAAHGAWARTEPEWRADLFERFAAIIRQHREELAVLECQDSGKPMTQALSDSDICARYFRFYGREIDSYYGLSIPLRQGFHVYTRREPYGVTGHIVAWNYPMQLFARAVAPAVVTGNCSVVKPADETPRSAVRLAELAIEAGFPNGVINVVTGLGHEAGAALSEHPGVDHISFVGSNAIGSVVAKAAAERSAPTVLELGGKSAHIVFADANLDEAATYVVKGILQNAGQTCSAGSRLIVHRSIRDALLERVTAKFRSTTIGPGVEDRDLGPLVSTKQQTRVKGLVDAAGGDLLVGGGVPKGFERGAFFEPTLIHGVDPYSQIAQEEVFGPVLVSMDFDSEDEAIHLANSTEYGLMAAVWTENLSRAHRAAADIVAGQVYVNAYGAGGGVELPFGGFKKSGYGREKGRESLDSFTATKTVIVKI